MRPRNLSYYVDLQKKRMLKLGRLQRLSGALKKCMVKFQEFVTSSWSFSLILLLLVLFFIFPMDKVFFTIFPMVSSWSFAYYLTVWQVYAAIVGFSFVALFFAFEAFFSKIPSTFKNLELEFRHEFYNSTYVQLILFFNLFSLVYVGVVINGSRSFQSLVLLGVGVLSICLLFSKTISFFETEKMEKIRFRIIKSEIERSIDAEIDRRLSLHLLLQLDKNVDYLKFELLTIEEQNRKLVQLDVVDRERISDIKIDKIMLKMKKVGSKFYLKRGLNEIVSPKYNTVGSLPSNSDGKTIKFLQKCFILKKEPPRRNLQLALDDIEEQLLVAVNRRSSRDLSTFLQIYYVSIEHFLRTLNLYGIKYNPEQAKQVDFLSEWEPIFRIQNDFYNLIELSIENGNREIIRSIINFVPEILGLSVENEDFMVFHRFKDFLPSIYCLAFEVDDKSLKDFIIDLLLRSVRDFISNRLLLHLGYSKVDKKQVEHYREYVILGLLLYEQMLKATLEKKSFDNFKKIDKILGEPSQDFNPEGHSPYVFEIEARLMNTALSQKEKAQLNEELGIAKAKIKLKQDIDRLILEICLGIGGWITELYCKGKLSKDETAQFIQVIRRHFKDWKNLGSSYNAIDTFDPFFPHAWKWWELEDISGRVVVDLRQGEWLARFYCIAGILLIPKEINAQDSMDPTPNSEGTLNAVKSQCSGIIANFAKWSVIMDSISLSEVTAKADIFIKLHERAVVKQKEIESKWLRDQPLDEEKISQFKTDVTNQWKTGATMRGIIEKIGNYVDIGSQLERIQPAVLDIFVPKDAFVKQDTKGYVLIQDFGSSLVRFENKKIIESILASCTSNTVVTSSSMNSGINASEAEMQENGQTPNVILVGSHEIIRNFGNTKEFQPSWLRKTTDLNLQSLEGYFNEIPVLLIHELEKNLVCLVNLKKAGTFTQYRVINGEKEFLHFEIKFIDEKFARDYIAKNPKILEDKNGQKLSENEVINKLQENVIVKIQESFEFTAGDSHACRKLTIEFNNPV